MYFLCNAYSAPEVFTLAIHRPNNIIYFTYFTLAIQPQRQLATEQEKRETKMHTYKQAKTRLDADAKMIDDGLYDMRLLRS